jgi:tetratricopeptide (TPR) repeat protein
MKSKLSFFLVLLAAIVISSCGSLNKMKDNAKGLTYKVTPSPLEVKGGEVEVTVEGKFPPKYFNKKAVLEATPVLKYQAGETAYKSLKMQGEKIQANDKVINYTSGGSFTISDKVAYKKDMQVSDLEIRLKGTMGKTVADFPSVKIADGIIATELLVVKDPRPIMLSDKYVRTTTGKLEASINYLINKADVRPSELKKEEIAKLKSSIKEMATDSSKKITSIELSAYASPDGPVDLNEKLAEKRKGSATDVFKKDAKKEKLELSDDIFKYLVTAEDWDGFKSLMEKSNIKHKELILRVLSMYSDPVVREKEIKNISAAYDEIKEQILPQLRRSKFTVNVEISGKSDEQLLALAQSDPSALELEEALYTAANLTQDLNLQLSIYQAASTKYPNDFRAKNNAGAVLVKLNRMGEAKAAFEGAKAIEDNETVKNNLGVCAFVEGDVAKAEELYTAGLGAGEIANYNLGIIKIMQGKYSDAMNYFGNTCEINNALVKILAKEHDAALSTLNCVKSEDALVYYLRAIIGARTQNVDMLFTNLTTACGKSAELKANAAKDLEFAKYFADEKFKSIVQ